MCDLSFFDKLKDDDLVNSRSNSFKLGKDDRIKITSNPLQEVKLGSFNPIKGCS